MVLINFLYERELRNIICVSKSLLPQISDSNSSNSRVVILFIIMITGCLPIWHKKLKIGFDKSDAKNKIMQLGFVFCFFFLFLFLFFFRGGGGRGGGGGGGCCCFFFVVIFFFIFFVFFIFFFFPQVCVF